MKFYRSYGIMRSGIHVVIAWLINKCPVQSVLFYNNIRQSGVLADRLISIHDTRVDCIRDKLTNNCNKASSTVLSFESRGFIDLERKYSGVLHNILVIRNPYNLLASSKKYKGNCQDILIDDPLKELWKSYAREFVGQTNYLPKKVCIVYDLFIADCEYRQRKAVELGLPQLPDELLTLGMGGGSSFADSSTNYRNRELEYATDSAMLAYKTDQELNQLWQEIMATL